MSFCVFLIKKIIIMKICFMFFLNSLYTFSHTQSFVVMEVSNFSKTSTIADVVALSRLLRFRFYPHCRISFIGNSGFVREVGLRILQVFSFVCFIFFRRKIELRIVWLVLAARLVFEKVSCLVFMT